MKKFLLKINDMIPARTIVKNTSKIAILNILYE